MSLPREKIEVVKSALEEQIEYSRYFTNDIDDDLKLLEEMSESILKDKMLEESMVAKLLSFNYRFSNSFLGKILNSRNKNNELNSKLWSHKDVLIKFIINPNRIKLLDFYVVKQFIAQKLVSTNGKEAKEFIDYIFSTGITDEKFIEIIFQGGISNPFVLLDSKTEEKSGFAEYIEPKLQSSSSFLGLKKTKGYGKMIHDYYKKTLNNSNHRNVDSFTILKYLYSNSMDSLNDEYKIYIFPSSSKSINLNCLFFLLDEDFNKFESLALELCNDSNLSEENRFDIYLKLNDKSNGKYHQNIVQIGEKSFNKFSSESSVENRYLRFGYTKSGPLLIVYSQYLLTIDEAEAKKRILQFIKESLYLEKYYLVFLDEVFEAGSVPYLIEAMFKKTSVVDRDKYVKYYDTLFEILSKYDVSNYLDRIIEYAKTIASKKSRKLATDFLANYMDKVIVSAQELTRAKKVDERIVGALILSHAKDEKIKESLMDLVDKERSDDTRDILLESLHDLKFSKPFTYNQVIDMVDKADARKKLSRWAEKWLDEESLPKLYWKEKGEVLEQKHIRFLFYRSKRAKDLNSDIEAKQLINQLNRDKSGKFVVALLKCFQDSNYNPKLKYYLMLSALIGGDIALTKLNTIFKSAASNKKYRMAAIIVGAIAMVGTNKALRIVDMIARKFSNKRPQISRAATEALEAAAQELQITADQLADRIIPDFGFEDHFKHFDAGDESYRAFISEDFKLYYFNEDNKIRKSIPKNTPKEIVSELKEITKEIKEVVKNQQGRLENYLVSERRWTVDEWKQYYFNNPIMLVYVQRLLWGIYEENKLTDVFYCDDVELYDVEDEEVEFKQGQHIGIVHPLHMTEEQLTKWKDKVYDIDITFEFPILDREISLVPEEEKEMTFTNLLSKTKIPRGADYVAGFLLKKGWNKSTSDGGYLEFYKILKSKNIYAYANIEGPAAYYQGGDREAILYEVSFRGEVWTETFKLKVIPKVFFSEVMADLKALIKA